MDVLGSLPISAILSFALASLLIELTPGPNMTYLALVAASQGRRAGFAAVAGVALGLAAIGLAAAYGVAQIVSASDLAYEILRWAGILYLLYLAWDAWRGEGDVVRTPADVNRRYFVRGLTTNLLNPKAAVFYVAVLPTFLVPGGALLAQSILLTSIYVAVATIVHAAIVVAAGSLADLLTDPAWERRARRLLAVLLALVAIWFGWSTAR